MRNITIKVDDSVAAWARVWAAKHNTSVSRMLGELLAEHMRAELGYETAMHEWMSWEPRPMRAPGEALPGRDELHER